MSLFSFKDTALFHLRMTLIVLEGAENARKWVQEKLARRELDSQNKPTIVLFHNYTINKSSFPVTALRRICFCLFLKWIDFCPTCSLAWRDYCTGAEANKYEQKNQTNRFPFSCELKLDFFFIVVVEPAVTFVIAPYCNFLESVIWPFLTAGCERNVWQSLHL